MVKVGDVVSFHGNVGTVRRVLNDELGTIAFVQWVGYSKFNLQPFEEQRLTVESETALQTKIYDMLVMTLQEVINSIDSEAVKEDVKNVLKFVNENYQIEQSTKR